MLPTNATAAYNETMLNRVYFYLAQQTNLHGADITFLSTYAFLYQPIVGQDDYAPSGSYAELLTSIFTRLGNSSNIAYN